MLSQKSSIHGQNHHTKIYILLELLARLRLVVGHQALERFHILSQAASIEVGLQAAVETDHLGLAWLRARTFKSSRQASSPLTGGACSTITNAGPLHTARCSSDTEACDSSPSTAIRAETSLLESTCRIHCPVFPPWLAPMYPLNLTYHSCQSACCPDHG